MTYAPYDSTSPNVPALTHSQPINGARTWEYFSTHTRAVVVASTHITDGQKLGMKVGDKFFVSETTTAAANSASDGGINSVHRVITVASTYVVLSIGVLISSAS